MKYVLAALTLFAASAFAQAPLAFEVASVKPNTSGSQSSSTRTPSNGHAFVGTNVTVRQLILSAYRLRGFQLTGAPAWIDADRFDIDARVPDDAPSGQVMNMVQELLRDRFRLVVHRETKEQPVYALVVARADGRLGPQLKVSTLDCTAPPVQGQANSCGTNTSVNNSGGVMKGGARSIDELAFSLSTFIADRMVVNRTVSPTDMTSN